MSQEQDISNNRGRADSNRQIRENQLDLLYELYLKGVEIGQANMAMLRDFGRLTDQAFTTEQKENIIRDKVNEQYLKFTSDGQRKIEENIDIFESDQPLEKLEIITSEELEERRKIYGHIFEGRKKPIEREDWLPESRTKHTRDFIEFIISINTLGFRYKTNYRKFSLYCQQAYQWLQDNRSYTDFYEEEERDEFIQQELKRCDDNSLYFLNKYVFYKEGDDADGRIKYTAAPAHELMAYLDDCGYSVCIAKCRQMAATTTLMALDVKDMIFKTNHFMKFITEDVEKAEEIFEDKLKFAFSSLPEWMRPNVLSERDNLFKLGYKPEKGVKEGVGSKIMVTAPKRTAVAGGAPQKVKIDEAGNIGILGQMLSNARPTMLFNNPKTREIEIKRQLWFWGTGGEMEKGGKSFETEFMAIYNAFMEGDYSAAIIPLFFDWTCRPFITQDTYDSEKKYAYSIQGNEAKAKRTEFHQSFPTSLSDVFRTSAKTLVDDDIIEASIRRIQDATKKQGVQLVQHGYFEPVYDFTKPEFESSDVPYRIIGANFIPTSDFDERASTTIFLQPQDGWINRYFQGTDPIDTDTGLSLMASAVWDKYLKCPAAIMNWRITDYRQVFLQTMLLGIYYDTEHNKTGIKELVESNRGTSYTQYKTDKGYDKEFVLNYELPHAFQNHTTINEGIGIDNKGQRNTMIINRLQEMISAYSEKIYFKVFFEQLKTFTCTMSNGGKEMWGPTNKKYFRDDVLFAVDFSYICAELCFPELQPKNILGDGLKTKIVFENRYDKNYNLIRVPVKKRV